MKICVIYEEGRKIYVQFSEEKFRLLLREYFDIYKNIDLAMDKIVEELKKEISNK